MEVISLRKLHAPSSSKNKGGKRDPEMHLTKKGNQYYFGAKAHIGVDDESDLVHSVVVTAVNVADVTLVDNLLHGKENVVCADAVTPVSKSAKSTRGAKSFGRLQPGVARTRSMGSAAPCIKRPARSRRPRPRCEPRSRIGQKYRADADAVRFVEPVDGTPTFVDVRRRGARVMQEMAAAKYLAVVDGPEKQRMLIRFQRMSFFEVSAAR